MIRPNSECLGNIASVGLNFSYKRPRSDGEAEGDIVAQTAKDLNAMSIEDRERLFEEINGVSSVIDETPELVEKSLSELNDEIARVRVDKSAYNLAMQMRPELKTDRKFGLMFSLLSSP